MQQAADDGPPTSTRSPSSRTLLCRISNPFAAKARTVADFTVQADDPHRRYSPGDLVRGHVILKLTKPIRVTHIVVCLHGFVQVYRTPGVPPAEGFRAHHSLSGKRRGSRKGEYFGNGFATLFEDEQVICGEGRLEEGNYRFDFDARFPNDTLPSSIEFERGAVTYMVSATMTRPTSISPITFHDQKITFAERIDIAKLLPPKARTISLEPLLKRTSTRSPTIKRQHSAIDTIRNDDASTADVTTPPLSVTGPGSSSIPPPRSSSPSAQSAASHRSSNPPASSSGSAVKAVRISDPGSITQNLTITPHSSPKIITATVESMKGGTLRGDTIPLRVSISHTKQIKSLHGVIVTLYRQARVDTHPALPIGPTTRGERRKFEDYYPRSLTGLGGLSLSGAGSSHMFRKDLAQTTMPLLVNPSTLTAELTPKLRVPDDVFPTIACVPGAMISFKYYLEVVIDIQGKLSGSERYFSQNTLDYTLTNDTTGPPGVQSPATSTVYKQQFIDTTALRREKAVVACILEIVIGTIDSDRRKDKHRATDDQPSAGEVRPPQHIDYAMPEMSAQPEGWPNDEYMNYDHYYPDEYHANSHEQPYYWTGNQEGPTPESLHFQPPSHVYDKPISEKERMRRAEEALLPSEAPMPNGDTSVHCANVPNMADIAFHRGQQEFPNLNETLVPSYSVAPASQVPEVDNPPSHNDGEVYAPPVSSNSTDGVCRRDRVDDNVNANAEGSRDRDITGLEPGTVAPDATAVSTTSLHRRLAHDTGTDDGQNIDDRLPRYQR